MCFPGNVIFKMAQQQFEDFSEIQFKLILDVLSGRGLSDAAITVNSVGEAGDNYVATVKRITAEKNGETFNIIAKIAPRIEQMRMTMKTRTLFINEHVMYNIILPKFTELEKSAGIPADERLRYAACYGTLTEEYEELILLEDLKDSNFIMLDRFKSLNDGDIKLVLNSFARLHSLSYALKYQEPDTYESFKNKVVDYWPMYSMIEGMNQITQLFENIETDAISVVSDQKYKKYIKGTLSKMTELGAILSSFDEKSRFSVIQQGDPKTNNIMYQLQEGQTVSCCMIDYQLSRNNSPVADLQYMIFNCTDHATRKQHFSEWMDYYHSQLEKSLNKFGLKVNFVYPRDQFDADMKRHVKMSVGTSVLLASILCRQSSDAEIIKAAMESSTIDNMDQMIESTKITSMDENTLTFFKSRVEGVVDSCLEFGLL